MEIVSRSKGQGLRPAGCYVWGAANTGRYLVTSSAGMGGADLYAWLKTERPDMKVLFMSGYMSREPLEGAFLKKPFTPAELVAKVRQLLSAATNSAP